MDDDVNSQAAHYLAGLNQPHLPSSERDAIQTAWRHGYLHATQVDPEKITALDPDDGYSPKDALSDIDTHTAALHLQVDYRVQLHLIPAEDVAPDAGAYDMILTRIDGGPVPEYGQARLEAHQAGFRAGLNPTLSPLLHGTIHWQAIVEDPLYTATPEYDTLANYARPGSWAAYTPTDIAFIRRYLTKQQDKYPDGHDHRTDNLTHALKAGIEAARALRRDHTLLAAGIHHHATQAAATYLAAAHQHPIRLLHEIHTTDQLPRTHLTRLDRQPVTFEQDQQLAAFLAGYRHIAKDHTNDLGEIDTVDPAIYGPQPPRQEVINPHTGLTGTSFDIEQALHQHFGTTNTGDADAPPSETIIYFHAFIHAGKLLSQQRHQDLLAYDPVEFDSRVLPQVAVEAADTISKVTNTVVRAGYLPVNDTQWDTLVLHQAGPQTLTGAQTGLLNSCLAAAGAAFQRDDLPLRAIAPDELGQVKPIHDLTW